MADLAPTGAGAPFPGAAPATLRARLGALRLRVRTALGCGALPNALVIGAAKGGTTSLYRWLSRHPAICASKVKEVKYFNEHHAEGRDWYAARFTPKHGENVRFEASPSYLWDPRVPLRVERLLGTPKLIVLLREPVDRAWSQYWMSVRLGHQTGSFAEALRREAQWFGPAGPFPADGSVPPASYMQHSFLGKGVYVPQIERWLSVFPRRCFHFIRSEDLFRSRGACCRGCLISSNLRRWRWTIFARTMRAIIPRSIRSSAARSSPFHRLQCAGGGAYRRAVGGERLGSFEASEPSGSGSVKSSTLVF